MKRNTKKQEGGIKGWTGETYGAGMGRSRQVDLWINKKRQQPQRLRISRYTISTPYIDDRYDRDMFVTYLTYRVLGTEMYSTAFHMVIAS